MTTTREKRFALGRLCAALLLAISSWPFAYGQAPPPSTEIFLLKLENKGGRLRAGQITNITRREGYDNQPRFIEEGRSILFTSIREDNQADIYKYTIADGATARVTDTKESEYSPTITPDGKHISVIRVEADSTQRLWKFPIAGGPPSLILRSIKPVGYHAWIDENYVALFILGTPNSLHIADLRADSSEKIADNIGRSLHKIPGKPGISFVHKLSDKEWVIKEMDTKTRKITPIVKTISGSEDYAWLPDGSILMASNAKLFRYDPAKDKEWIEIADFATSGLKQITRIAASPKGDHIALVASLESK